MQSVLELSRLPGSEELISASVKHKHHSVPPYRDLRTTPLYFALVSIVFFVLPPVVRNSRRIVASYLARRRARSRQPLALNEEDDELGEEEEEVVLVSPPTAPPRIAHASLGFSADLRRHIEACGGSYVFVLNMIRFIACFVLLVLTILSAERSLEDSSPDPAADGASVVEILKKGWKKGRKGKKKQRQREEFGREEWVEIAQCVCFLYATCLSLATLVYTKTKALRKMKLHLSAILLSSFAIYAYRNLIPLATFHGKPLDLHRKGESGWSSLIWWRIGCLALAGIVVPAVMPREYIPVDPQNPVTPIPEQTASWVSLIFYTHLNPLIVAAWKVPSLPASSLPPVADYDRAEYLNKKNMHQLDPFELPDRKEPRHIFWSIVIMFKGQIAKLVFLLVIKNLADFIRPLAIQQLLSYLEDADSSEVRPLTWILLLFFGPLVSSLTWQFYIYTTARLFVRNESLLSQLILKHALRLRFVGAPESKAGDGSTRGPSGVTTPVPALAADGAGVDVAGIDVATGIDGSDSASATNKTPVKCGEDDAGETKKTENLTGRINSLIGSDLEAIFEARDILVPLLYGPMQIVLAIIFLYRILDWSALVGFAVLCCLIPGPGYIVKMINDVLQAQTAKGDARIETITEIMSSVRMVKMFAWENKVSERISNTREAELKLIAKKNIIEILNNSANFMIPLVTMVISFASYTLIQKKPLSAATIFSAITVFDMITTIIFWMVYEISSSISGKISLDRLNGFLHDSELLDAFEPSPSTVLPSSASSSTSASSVTAIANSAAKDDEASFIGFKNNATFAWLREYGEPDPMIRNFRLRLSIEFRRGEINIISGPTGAGKSSILSALLGEMHYEPSENSSFNLPRAGGVAYVPQEPWLLNASIRDNIILNNSYDQERFEKVISLCSLTRDLQIFAAGEQTEVGEKGVTLSGGQKARVTLARAIYSSAEILLLDDVLSALDAQTAKWIVHKCLRSNLVQGRTVILATHHISLVLPIASYIVHLSSSGVIKSHGPVERAVSQDKSLQREIEEDKKEDTNRIDEGPEKPVADALVQEEEKSEGAVAWSSYRTWIDGLGWGTLITFLVAVVVAEATQSATTFWLGVWSEQYTSHDDPSEVSVPFYLGIYAALIAAYAVVYTMGMAVYWLGCVRAGRNLHERLVKSVLNSTSRWLDQTPVGRIIARFSKDFRATDGVIPMLFSNFTQVTFILLIKGISVIVILPLFSIPALVLGLVGLVFGQAYLHAQLAVKREMSNSKSPLFNHLNGSINGAVSIRAYGIQDWVTKRTCEKVDTWVRPTVVFYDLNRWITVIMESLAWMFTAATAYYLVYGPRRTAGLTGWLLEMAAVFSSNVIWWVRIGNMFAVESNSLERIVDYFSDKIPQEVPSTKAREPPASWPTSGSLVVEDFTARYSESGPAVLDGLNFSIKSGEKIGIVGRTGAGKSSLAVALLRMIPTQGKVFIDGIDTSTINLQALRSAITIIPQDPILISGDVRSNIDPFEENDDAVLNDALHASGLSNIQGGTDHTTAQTITLDTLVVTGGSNLSAGQRQVITLARAIVRRSSIVIMDEATSSVDFQTDDVIQKGLRRELAGVTVLTIAHRLRSIIDYDRVLVLGDGKIVAFDTPQNLLCDRNSYFSTLVASSGEEGALRMAAGAP